MGNQPNRDRSFNHNNSNNKSDIIIEHIPVSNPISNENTDIWNLDANRESKSLTSFSNTDSKASFTIVLEDCRKNQNSSLNFYKDEKLRFICYSQDVQWAHVEKFGTFEKGWISKSLIGEIFEESQDSDFYLQQFKWYHGAILRSFAEYLLNSGITGSFLVRESESNRMLRSLSLRYEGKSWHFRISKDGNNKFFITESQRFESIPKLIEYHSKYADGLPCQLLYPAPKRAHATVFGFDDTSDVWEIDRTEIKMKNQLGGGQYGIVYEGYWNKHKCKVAVKTVKSDITMADDFLEEARLMKSLQHPNLVRLLGVCTREPPNYIITEFMENGNLLDYLRNKPKEELSPPVLLYMAIQIASAMAYLEQQNFIHRDLAARNCLVGVDNIVKVADFGLARCMERDDTYTAHAGAKFPIKWTAPEGLAYNLFSTKSDVWAFGVLLWELATYGMTPYPGIELQDVFVYLQKGNIMARPIGCPDNVYELMKHCWKWQPEDRPTFKELLCDLEIMLNDINEQVDLEIARQLSDGLVNNATYNCNDDGSNHHDNCDYPHDNSYDDDDGDNVDDEPLPKPPPANLPIKRRQGPPVPPVRTTPLKDRSMTASFSMSSNKSLMDRSISEDFPSELPEADNLPLPPPEDFLHKSIDAHQVPLPSKPSPKVFPRMSQPLIAPPPPPSQSSSAHNNNAFSYLTLPKSTNNNNKPDIVKRTKSDRSNTVCDRDLQSELKSRLKFQSKSDEKSIDSKISENKKLVSSADKPPSNILWPNRKSVGNIKPLLNSSGNANSIDIHHNGNTNSPSNAINTTGNSIINNSKRMSWAGGGGTSINVTMKKMPPPSRMLHEEDRAKTDEEQLDSDEDNTDEFITKETLISEMNSLSQQLHNFKQQKLDLDLVVGVLDKLETIHLGATRYGNSSINSAKIKFRFIERCTDLTKSIQALRRAIKPLNCAVILELGNTLKSTLTELKSLIDN